MTIHVFIKTVYGNQTVYPACEQAKIFASMVGQSTLTPRNIDHIKRLGYTVQVVSELPSTL